MDDMGIQALNTFGELGNPEMYTQSKSPDPNIYFGRENWEKVVDSMIHIHGPAHVEYGLGEVIVLCLVRDGQPHIQSFIQHYFSMGVRHIVFLDNGSSDETISIAKAYPDVTVLQTKLAYKNYKHLMKQYLIRRFGQYRWSLYADIDELFDFPYSNRISLEALISFLSTHSYTALVAHMLDMFSEKPLLELTSMGNGESLKDRYRFYDISAIWEEDYSECFCPHNIVSNDRIAHLRGGIRNILFDFEGSLTKHPLIFLDDSLQPMCTSHKVENASVADLSGVLLHYKFVENFHDYTARAVGEESYAMNSMQYKQYWNVIQKTPNLHMWQSTTKELHHVNDLVEEGFLDVSEEYMRWVEDHS